MPIPTVELADKVVGRVGLGLMQLTWTPKPPPEEQAFAAMKAAADAGATTWSSATFYGNDPGGDAGFDNLRLVGRFFKQYPDYRERVQLVVKGGVGPGFTLTNDLEENRRLLAKTRECVGGPVDVYLPARVKPGVDPVEWFKPFDALKKEGLFTALGASEVSAPTLRALTQAGMQPCVVEIEVSLWSYDSDVRDVLAWSADTLTPIYAYSPLGRGFLTRTWKTPEDVPEGSFQKHSPRFQGDNFYHNLKLVDVLDEIAKKKGLTTAQLAIAWVCSLGDYVIPIPGSSNAERARQNTEAANITLTIEDRAQINEVLMGFDLAGGRYPEALSSALMA